jgi:hypothetical protein
MSVHVHHNDEIAKTLMVVVAVVAFVVIMLTKVPEWISPQGGPGAPDVGQTVRMFK